MIIFSKIDDFRSNEFVSNHFSIGDRSRGRRRYFLIELSLEFRQTLSIGHVRDVLLRHNVAVVVQSLL
jgi:hypothetical protein